MNFLKKFGQWFAGARLFTVIRVGRVTVNNYGRAEAQQKTPRAIDAPGPHSSRRLPPQIRLVGFDGRREVTKSSQQNDGWPEVIRRINERGKR